MSIKNIFKLIKVFNFNNFFFEKYVSNLNETVFEKQINNNNRLTNPVSYVFI